MARATLIQTNFTAGELAPALYGRTDISKYHNGARRLRNMVVLPQGGAYRRPGTRFVGEVVDSADVTIVKEFIFSTSQPYILEFGDLYVKIYFDGAAVAMSAVVTPWTSADLSQLSFTQSADVIYIAHPSFQTRTLTRTAHTTWTLALYAPEDGPYLDESTTVKITVSGITESVTLQASASTFVIGDVGSYVEWRVGDKWKLGKITGYSSATLVAVEPQPVFYPDNLALLTFSAPHVKSDIGSPGGQATFDPSCLHKFVRISDTLGGRGPEPTAKWYKITDYVDTTKVKGTVQTEVTYTWPATTLKQTTATFLATITASSALFVASDATVGRHIRLRFGNEWRWYTMANYTSSTVIGIVNGVTSDEVFPTLPRDPADADEYYQDGVATSYRLGAWSTATGWPAIVEFHQQRLCFGRNTYQPTTLWMTVTADYANMAPTTLDGLVLDTSAITITLVSGEVNAIQWMESGPVLLVGTDGAEWQIKPSSVAAAITPTNIAATPQTFYGSEQGQVSVKVGARTLCIQRGGKRVRELQYDFNLDAFTSKDATIMSPHLADEYGQLIQLGVQTNPFTIIWAVTENGYLLGMTYEPDQDVIAWHVHQIGGNGLVQSLAIVPSISGVGDDVYLVVKRTINATTRRYIERIDRTYAPSSAADCFYMDAALSLDNGSSTDTGNVSGLSHLNTATVTIMVDGVQVGSGVPSGGAVWVGYKGRKIVVGFANEAYIYLLDPEGGAESGSSQGQLKRISEAAVRIYRTAAHMRVGSAEGYTNPTENFRGTQDPDSGTYKLQVPAVAINAPEDSGAPSAPYPDPTNAAGLETLTHRTGDFVLSADDGYDLGARLILVQYETYAFNVLAVVYRLNTNA